MLYAALPDDTPRRLPFFLAMEEWLARNRPDDLFFMWQVDPTVICGRNQIIDLEVDIDYCSRNSIDVCRRKSGGGCVFADRNNIMFSYITTARSVETTFAGYTAAVAEMLKGLGLDASATSRNDVLIGDRKVSGNAFYHIPELNRCIVHGTMLYDTDFTHITHAITPSRAKLESKGVKSVASRITTVKEHLPISLDDFKAHARKSMCGGKEITLTAQHIAEISEMEAELETPEWIYRKTSGAATVRTARIEGVGELRADITLDANTIRQVNISGDFFMLADIDSALLDRLKGVEYSREAIEKALAGVKTEEIISSLSQQQFINLII